MVLLKWKLPGNVAPVEALVCLALVSQEFKRSEGSHWARMSLGKLRTHHNWGGVWCLGELAELKCGPDTGARAGL